MPFETEPEVLAWFERALTDDRHRIRRGAVELLEYVDSGARSRWLTRAESDTDPRVVASAVVVGAILAHARETAVLDLLESDLAEGMDESLGWEWEYSIRVCRGLWVPSSCVLVWTRAEDDRAARSMALMKAFPITDAEADAMPIITDKCLVNQYTRQARSMGEAMRWHHYGRPRFQE